MKYVSEEEAYQNLANAIVKKAATEYRAALRGLERNPGYRRDVEKLERFFHSRWYATLTDLDGDYLIERLKKDERERSLKRQKGVEQ